MKKVESLTEEVFELRKKISMMERDSYRITQQNVRNKFTPLLNNGHNLATQDSTFITLEECCNGDIEARPWAINDDTKVKVNQHSAGIHSNNHDSVLKKYETVHQAIKDEVNKILKNRNHENLIDSGEIGNNEDDDDHNDTRASQ